MSCSNISAGFTLDCNDAQGGVDKVFIANGPVEGITESSGNVTAITVGGSALTPSDFFTFEMPRQSGSYTETVAVSQENGTVTYDQALTLVFNKMEAAKRNQLLLMAEATSMVVVFKTNDETPKYFSVGLERGAYVSAATVTSGTAYADRQGYEITISGLEAAPSYEITSSIVEA